MAGTDKASSAEPSMLTGVPTGLTAVTRVPGLATFSALSSACAVMEAVELGLIR